MDENEAQGEDLEYFEDAKDEEPSNARQALVQRDIERVTKAKNHWKDQYDNIRKWQRYARHGCDPKIWTAEKVRVPLVQRVVKQKTSALYAKNPKVQAKPRQQLLSTYWDGTPETLNSAIQQLQAANDEGRPPDMEWLRIVQDASAADQRRSDLKLIGRTLELLFNYFLDELKVKRHLKRAVQRATTDGFAVIKNGYKRNMALGPEERQALRDDREQLAAIERLIKEQAEGEWTEHDAEAEELRMRIAKYEAEEDRIEREGLVLDFPRSTSMIPSTDMTNLKGFEGCSWVAQEFLMTPDRIQEVYNVQVDAGARKFQAGEVGYKEVEVSSSEEKGEGVYVHRVFEIWDIEARQRRTVCDGHNDYLDDPEEETVFYEAGHPFVVMSFLDVEDEENPWPNSYVGLMVDLQDEYNRSRDSLRAHRAHSLPKYFTSKGALSDEDKKKLADGKSFHVYELDGKGEDQKVSDLISDWKGSGVDPNVHSEAQVVDDMSRIGATTEAAMGAVAGDSSATEASIAEDTHTSAVQSDIDEVDEALSEMAQVCGAILLTEMDAESVKELIGPGAMWPNSQTGDGESTMTNEEAAKSVYLSIKAGSSGKPNASKQLAKLERAFNPMSQIQGVNPRFLAEKYLEALDPGFDIEEAFTPDGLSIIARNALVQAQARAGGQAGPDAASPADQASAGAQGTNGGSNPGGVTAAPGGREMPTDVQNNTTGAA